MELQLFNKKCVVEYDGTNFHGWQVQGELRTVQKEIEKGLSKIYKRKIKITGSGRTDTGVHALGQTFNYITDKYLPNNSIVMGLNSIMPKDIVILSCEDVPLDFHSQRSAISKTYIYKILNQTLPSALKLNRVWHVREKLDILKLKNYLDIFVGEHDFSSMCIKKSIKDNPVRTVNFINIRHQEEQIEIEINANGFMHNMVRNIIGTTIYLYRRKISYEQIIAILNSKNRSEAGPTAPPQGLYLKEVIYK